MIDRLSRFALLCLCVVPVWMLIRKPWQRPIKREILLGMFVSYIAALLVMALEGTWASPADMLVSARDRLAGMEGIHLTPFRTIGGQLAALPSDESLTQLLGNTVLFAPWGFFLPLLWEKFRRLLPVAGMCLALTVFIESTQLFIGRTVDVDDLILNFLGGMCGAGLWWIIRRLRKE